MRRFLSFILVILLQPFTVDAQEIFTPDIKTNAAFKAGENLTFQIRYGFIVAGITTLSLSEEIYNDNPVFHATAIGQTTGMANTLYGVRDIYESWFDKVTNLPYKQVRNIREGHYTKYNEVTYDRKNNTVD